VNTIRSSGTRGICIVAWTTIEGAKSMRGDRYLLFGALAFLVVTLPLQAQQLDRTQSGVTRATQPQLTLVTRTAKAAAPRERSVRRWPFIVGGAVMGSVGAGVWLARGVKWDDDGMALPVVPIAAVLTAGAGIGAIGGWTVSAVVGRGRS
jgi:hypothetical protein